MRKWLASRLRRTANRLDPPVHRPLTPYYNTFSNNTAAVLTTLPPYKVPDGYR